MGRIKSGQIDRVQSNVRAFGIAGDWKATALEQGVVVWVIGLRRSRKGGGGLWPHGVKKRKTQLDII